MRSKENVNNAEVEKLDHLEEDQIAEEEDTENAELEEQNHVEEEEKSGKQKQEDVAEKQWNAELQDDVDAAMYDRKV